MSVPVLDADSGNGQFFTLSSRSCLSALSG